MYMENENSKPYKIKEAVLKDAAYRKLIKPELADELYDKVLAIVVAGKKYRDPEYSAQQLAKDLNTNPRYLSAVINSRFGQNYSCLVNEFRIRDAQHMLTDKRYKNLTMEQIGMAVGFSNRQSFYAAFFKYKGVAPHKFRAQYM
ncbi:MAG: AraC family transcriptional regulator [Bacteroidaceae bacterium]|nr:AraC family transcriptional regulator [Bacteroidaceae bacterium]